MAFVGCRPGKEPKLVTIRPDAPFEIQHLNTFDSQQVQSVSKFAAPVLKDNATLKPDTLPQYIDATVYHSDTIINPYFDLIPVSEVSSEQYRVIVFISSWLGIGPNIWVAFEDNKSHKFTRPLFTGISITALAHDFEFDFLKTIVPKLAEDYPNIQYYLTGISTTLKHGVLHFEYDIEAVITSAEGWQNAEERVVHTPFLRLGEISKFVEQKPYKIKLVFSGHDKIQIQKILLDSDNDGLTDLLERHIGTEISSADTDNDGIDDLYDNNPKYQNIPKKEYCQIYNAIFQDFAVKGLDYYTVLFPSNSTCTITTANCLIIDNALNPNRVIRFFKVRKNPDGTKAAVMFDKGIPWRSHVYHWEAYLSKTLDGWKVDSMYICAI